MQGINESSFQGSILSAQRDVESLFAFSEQVSAESISDTTSMCADREVNAQFTSLVAAAEASVMAALDDVDGSVLTHFDSALDELRLARQEFFRPGDRNRVNSHVHVDNANREFAAGVAAFVND